MSILLKADIRGHKEPTAKTAFVLDQIKKTFSPKVKDGSTIVVNEKIASEPFDLTQFATNWTAIISSLLTAALISQQIQN